MEPSASSPTTMRAWTHTTQGDLLQVFSYGTIPKPEILKSSEVLIKISYAALNPGATVMMQLIPMLFRSKPSIPEMDFSGTIVRFGSSQDLGVTKRDLRIGSRVFGNIPIGEHVRGGKGSLAEYVIVPVDRICEIPNEMKSEEAAGLGVAGCSGLAYLDTAKAKGKRLKEGDRILINGASGGVGTVIVQLAKQAVGDRGVVVAICSSRNAEFVRGLGADEVIDYTEHASLHTNLAEEYKDIKFDYVFDTIGIQDLWNNCPSYLKPGQPYMSISVSVPKYTYSAFFSAIYQPMSNALKPTWLGGVDRPWVQVSGVTNLEQMERLADMVREGRLKMVVDSVWGFKDALKAYERIISKRATGKVIACVYGEDEI